MSKKSKLKRIVNNKINKFMLDNVFTKEQLSKFSNNDKLKALFQINHELKKIEKIDNMLKKEKEEID